VQRCWASIPTALRFKLSFLRSAVCRPKQKPSTPALFGAKVLGLYFDRTAVQIISLIEQSEGPKQTSTAALFGAQVLGLYSDRTTVQTQFPPFSSLKAKTKAQHPCTLWRKSAGPLFRPHCGPIFDNKVQSNCSAVGKRAASDKTASLPRCGARDFYGSIGKHPQNNRNAVVAAGFSPVDM
jgi:hypothetical protein